MKCSWTCSRRPDRYKHVFGFTSVCQPRWHHLLASGTLFLFVQTFIGRRRKGLRWHGENHSAGNEVYWNICEGFPLCGKVERPPGQSGWGNPSVWSTCWNVWNQCGVDVFNRWNMHDFQYFNLKRFDLGNYVEFSLCDCSVLFSFPLIWTVHVRACQ